MANPTIPLTHHITRVAASYLDADDRNIEPNDLAPILTAAERAERRIAAAHADTALSAAGRTYETERAVAQVLADIEADSAIHTRWADLIADAEAQALGTPSVDPAVEREIRQALASKPLREQRMTYLNSIGNDPATQAAFENASASISIIDADTREQARKRKLAAAPPSVRQHIEQLRQRLAARQHVASVARRTFEGLVR